MAGRLPAGWDADIPTFTPGGTMATRKAINAIAARVPELFGGSADLNPSTNTALKGPGTSRIRPCRATGGRGRGGLGLRGTQRPFGVREHAMGAIASGLALHGRLFTATFLMFADYMWPRFLSRVTQPVVYVFTHDSIAVGEDGPTHSGGTRGGAQDHPHLTVLRPADAKNGGGLAVRHDPPGRSGLHLLTRQNLPILEARGGYVLADAKDWS